MITDIPIIQVYSFTALMSSGIPISVINAATVELYPTALRWVFPFLFLHFFHVNWYWKNRAMAMCISLMFGRLGGVVGANTVALLLDNHCQSAFYLSGSSLLGMFSHFQLKSSVKPNQIFFILQLLAYWRFSFQIYIKESRNQIKQKIIPVLVQYLTMDHWAMHNCEQNERELRQFASKWKYYFKYTLRLFIFELKIVIKKAQKSRLFQDFC